MATPRKRGREEDHEDENESPSFLAGVFGLFSTAKKKQKRTNPSVESSTQPTRMPRLNLSSPYAHVSPPAEIDGTRAPPVPAEAATNGSLTPAPVPASRPPAPSPWQAAPIRFSHGFPAPLASNRRRLYRPMSRTLVVTARKRRRPTNTEFNAELAARVLAQSAGLFQPQDNGYRAPTTVRGRRQMGTNQHGSRLAALAPLATSAPPPAASKQVRFEEPSARVQETPQELVATPRFSRLPTRERVATPYAAHPSQPKGPPAGTSLSVDKNYPLPVDDDGMDRQAASPDSKFAFDVDEPGDASQVALVPSTRSISSSFKVISVPQPSRNPRHVFQLGEQVSEVDAPAEESPTEEQEPKELQEQTAQQGSPGEQKPTPQKRSKIEGWGDCFASLPRGWKCEACYVANNPDDANKCLSCETKRPGLENGASSGEAGGDAPAGGVSNRGGASGAAAPFAVGANGSGANGTPAQITVGSANWSGGFVFGGAEETKNGANGSGANGTPAQITVASADWSGGFVFGGVEETKNEDHGVIKFGTATNSAVGFTFGKTNKSSEAEAPKPTGFSFKKTDTSSQAQAPKPNGLSFGIPKEAKKDAPAMNSMQESGKKKELHAPETPAPPSNAPFSFGTSTPADSATFSSHVGGTITAPSAPPVTTAVPTTFKSASVFGSLTPALSQDDNQKKKRRTTDNDKEEVKESTSSASSTPAPFSFGSTGPAVVQQFVFGAPATPARSAVDTVSFGAPAADSDRLGGAALSGTAPSRDAPTFGATPAPPAPAHPFSFGFTPVASSIKGSASNAPVPSTDGFGQSGSSDPFGTSVAAFNFGVSSTALATTPASAAPAFNFDGTSTASGMTPVPAAPAFTFGGLSTAAPAAPTAFDTSAPAPQSQGFSFGSTLAPASIGPFGAPGPVASAPSPSGPYGAPAAPAPAPGGFSFGGFGGPTTTPTQGFGLTPSTTPAAPGDFGATPSFQPVSFPIAGGFSIGSGGGGGRSAASSGRRRIVRAKRPPGSSGR